MEGQYAQLRPKTGRAYYGIGEPRGYRSFVGRDVGFRDDHIHSSHESNSGFEYQIARRKKQHSKDGAHIPYSKTDAPQAYA